MKQDDIFFKDLKGVVSDFTEVITHKGGGIYSEDLSKGVFVEEKQTLIEFLYEIVSKLYEEFNGEVIEEKMQGVAASIMMAMYALRA